MTQQGRTKLMVGAEEKCRPPWLTGDEKFKNQTGQNALKKSQRAKFGPKNK